ncbi:MAG: response regulator transcription factor [Anaerolineae bacterium]|nr:response regulator transcription factor [Anaerolineae bacterium]
MIRVGLHALLSAEADLEVIGEAANGLEVLQLTQALQPDVVLLDLGMPDLGGIRVIQELRQQLPKVHVLILTMHEDAGLLRKAFRLGATGYVVKRALESELVDAIRAVMRGELYVHPAMTQFLLAEHADATEETADGKTAPTDVLTPREVEVLGLIAQGNTNRQVAKLLNLSVRTVEGHRASLMNKLELYSRAELVRYAIKHDLIGEK